MPGRLPSESLTASRPISPVTSISTPLYPLVTALLSIPYLSFTHHVLCSVGPPGVSSGISFRNLPDASLMAIRSVCLHFEKKCSGQYSSKSLASRYIFQMSREIQGQLQAMSANSGGQGQRVRDLENVLTEWNENFGRDSEDGTQGVFGIVPMTPTALKHMLAEQRGRIKELEREMRELTNAKDEAATQVRRESVDG